MGCSSQVDIQRGYVAFFGLSLNDVGQFLSVVENGSPNICVIGFSLRGSGGNKLVP